MPGMLTLEQMSDLAYASGPEFDRLFLESMQRHHEGTLQIVADLFAGDGAGEEPEVFALANHIVSDQQTELARTASLLDEIDGGQAPQSGVSPRSG